MATFPGLEPNSRSYDLGAFPLTEQPSLSAGTVRFLHGTQAYDLRLTLEYVQLADADAAQIRSHYQLQAGTYRSFMLPPIIWKGHTFSGNVFPPATRWRYAETPEETHHETGRYSMSVSLVSDGTSEQAFLAPVDVTLISGVATGA
jgi:hypothetical protein